jgi:hypothetical protein
MRADTIRPLKLLFDRTQSQRQRSTEESVVSLPAYRYTLLGWRLTGLGINPKYIERKSRDLMLDLRSRCAMCEDKERCLEGMMDFRHPPGWQGYCPNAGSICSLLTAPEFRRARIGSLSDRSENA